VITSVYKLLLRLYPWDYITTFAVEMVTAFENACEEHQLRGRWSFICFAMSELSSLMVGAGTEWLAKLTTDRSLRGRCLPDLRMMRPPGVPWEVWFAAAGSNVEQKLLPTAVARAQERVALLLRNMMDAIAKRDYQAAFLCREQSARYPAEHSGTVQTGRIERYHPALMRARFWGKRCL